MADFWQICFQKGKLVIKIGIAFSQETNTVSDWIIVKN